MPGPRLATRSTSGLPHFGHSLGGETKADRNSGSHQRTLEKRRSPTGKDEDRNQEEDQLEDFLAWIWGTSRHDWEAKHARPENPWRPFFVQGTQDVRSFTLPPHGS